MELPGNVQPFAALPLPRLAVQDRVKRQPLKIRLQELYDTADWMDAETAAASEPQQWGNRMRSIRLALITAHGLTNDDTLTVDGLLHLLGMVGSGKSTLYTVLAVYLARQEQRVVIVQSDVASLLQLEEVFESLRRADPRIVAVPLVGRSTRLVHLNRLHVADAGSTLSDKPHPGYRMLSTICPLDGLRQDVDPIPPAEEPCTRLYPIVKGQEGACDCPFLPVCPVHLPTRELASTSIWLATPASLLAARPQAPLIEEEMRYVELAMRHADGILVDEADLVQVQFDDRFAPTEGLVGRYEGWLDRLAQQVMRQIYRPGRPLVGRAKGLD
ncbi:MAG: hypothetical protein H0T73_20160, partial [Ardenticatenales bacterium]|nr:hypothetical protein [Ardenticatenales bacterium]